MYILGLTGSIGMGKSWGSKSFVHAGVPVHDADACVHGLLSRGGAAVDDVVAAFPGSEDNAGGVSRGRLSDIVFGDRRALALLEYILHPQVRRAQFEFLARHARDKRALVVLDIPLLFETGAGNRVDSIVVMSAPPGLQAARVLRRPGMDEDKFHAILAAQIPDSIKRLGAEFVVKTGSSRGQSFRHIAQIAKITKLRKGRVWGPGWGN